MQPETDEELSLSIRQFYLDSFDEYVFNQLPPYLIRISDMKLLSRNEIWENLRPLVEPSNINLEEARRRMGYYVGFQNFLKFHFGEYLPNLLIYAIFSHRWGAREPRFRDMSNEIHGEKPVPAGLGYEKLLKFCEKARDDYGCAYAWSDTCCINKESSSELEAIRSMYRWYRDAYVCIAHLVASSSVEDFPREPWFTRGWTLQELLAPRRLRFFGKDWIPICPIMEEEPSRDGWEAEYFPHPDDKSSHFMLNAVSQVTDIDVEHLQSFKPESVFVSEKMRWASKRKTTRVEDVAYSLLGIFDVSMPIAYGEGGRAFYRLIEAIAQRSTDLSLLAWAGKCSTFSHALPSSPACYEARLTSAFTRPRAQRDLRGRIGDSNYAINKLGLRVKLLVVQAIRFDSNYSDSSSRFVTTEAGYRFAKVLKAFGFPPHKNAPSIALGIVDYNRANWKSDLTHGSLRAGEHYFCLLLNDQPSEWDGDVPVMHKYATDNLLTLQSTVDVTREAKTVCISVDSWP